MTDPFTAFSTKQLNRNYEPLSQLQRHIKVFPHVGAILVEAERNPLAVSQVHALAVPQCEEPTPFLAVLSSRAYRLKGLQ